MMNYQEMSNTQINVEVAKALGFDSKLFLEAVECGEKPLYGEIFDPCSSWNDAGPIAEEFKIAAAHYKKGDGYIWHVFGPGDINYSQIYDSNPRRAICIVFLMMKGGE